jgi:hypothetical protein
MSHNFQPTRFYLPYPRDLHAAGTYLALPVPDPELRGEAPITFDREPPEIVVRRIDLARDQLFAISQQQLTIAAMPPARLPGVDPTTKPPWEAAPPGAQPFDIQGILTTPALGTVDAVVLTYTIPFGWDAVIRGISNRYTGPGFSEGGGDLIWRIYVNRAAAKNYDNIRVTFGTGDQNRKVDGNGIRVFGTEVVEYTVSVDAAAAIPIAGTRIIVGISGYEYPTP